MSRIPPGHPEGYLEGFANIYAEAAAAITGGVSDEYDEMVDPASGAAYFVHRQSGASVWERPSFVGS